MQYNLNKYLKIYEFCQIVNGYQRSTICNLRKNNYKIIPNSLFYIIKNYEKCSLQKLFDNFQESTNIIHEYLEFLLTNNFAFLCDKKI